MASSPKRRRATRTVVVHQCNQEEYLKRVNTVLFGNGHPEDGLAFIVRAFMKTQGDIQEDIAHIRNELVNLSKSHDTTRSAFEKYAAEEKGFEAGRKETEGTLTKTKSEKRADFLKYLQAISVVIAAIGVCFGAYFGYKNRQGTSKMANQIENLGTPITVTRSGKLYALPDTVSIKMINNNRVDTIDEDTIK